MEAFFTASKAARKKPGHSGFHYRSSRFPRPHPWAQSSGRFAPSVPLAQKTSLKQSSRDFPRALFFRLRYN